MKREGIVEENVQELHLQQFGHGQSNPTYLVQVALKLASASFTVM